MTKGAPRTASRESAVARRAIWRFARRLYLREWRQQVLIFVLVVTAVGAVVLASAISTNSPAPVSATVGTATAVASFTGTPTQLTTDVSRVRALDSRINVIENAPEQVPGSTDTFSIRSQDPREPFGAPLLSLVSGRYPTATSDVAVTAGLANELRLSVGKHWSFNGHEWTVSGVVVNPSSLLDEFALVAPGSLHDPQSVTILLDPNHEVEHTFASNITTAQRLSNSNFINPGTITLALALIGMMLIALVSVAGFTAIAQRRLRALGMIGAIGASSRQVGRVVRANGVVLGVAGALLGAVLGFAAWAAYRPALVSSSHHEIKLTALPWSVVGSAVALAIVATYVAASYPARAMARLPIVRAFAGRPAAPRQLHRSALPGTGFVLGGVALLFYAGRVQGPLELLLGLVGLIVGMMLLAPLSLSLLATLTGRAPVAVRLATRDLARFRARSGSALSAMSLGIFITVLVIVQVAARYGNVIDYVGPNLASNQVVVYSPTSGQAQIHRGPGPRSNTSTTPASPTEVRHALVGIERALGATSSVSLYSSGFSILRAAPGRQYSGSTYVATPQLLRAYGIPDSSISASTDVLTARPGFAGLSHLRLYYHGQQASNEPSKGRNPNNPAASKCPVTSCVANPPIQTVSALPSGTSAPNTVITESAVRRYHTSTSLTGWLLETAHDPSAAAVATARADAATVGMTIETRNSAPTSNEVGVWATLFGALLSLGILAMTIGLIRSESGDDLRVLEATGASSNARRTIAATSAGGLAILAALAGTLAAYVGSAAFLFDGTQDSVGELWNIPLLDLILIVVGLPVIAFVAVWLLTGNGRSRPLRGAAE